MKNSKPKQKEINPLQQKLDWFNRQLDLLKQEINVERKNGLPDKTTLEKKLLRAQREVDSVMKKMEKAKAHIKRRKQEIKQWKESIDRLAQEEKTEKMNQLQKEILWRSQDIAAKEAAISALYEAKYVAMKDVEMLTIQNEIVTGGFHKKDINQDPRIVALKEERDMVKNELTGAKA